MYQKCTMWRNTLFRGKIIRKFMFYNIFYDELFRKFTQKYNFTHPSANVCRFRCKCNGNVCKQLPFAKRKLTEKTPSIYANIVSFYIKDTSLFLKNTPSTDTYPTTKNDKNLFFCIQPLHIRKKLSTFVVGFAHTRACTHAGYIYIDARTPILIE